MSAGPLIAELSAVFFLTLLLLNKYGDWRRQHLVVTISTFIGWFFSFIIMFILPLDIAITFYDRCLLAMKQMHEEENARVSANITNISELSSCEQPTGFMPDHVLLRMWRIVYWTAQLLTWIVLPLMQSYSNAGDFSALGKLRSAAYNNVTYYGTYLFLLIILIIYAIANQLTLNAEHLKVILISVSNTWGLFLLVVLLGYGLIEVPRQFWQMGNQGYRLNKTYFDIDKLWADKNNAEDTFREAYKETRNVLTLLHNEHILRGYAQTILAKFPSNELVSQITSRSSDSFSATPNIEPDNESFVTVEYLIQLHKRVISVVQSHHQIQAQWHALIQQALYMEDVRQAEITGQFIRRKGHQPNLFQCSSKFQFFWHVIYRKTLLKTLGLLFSIMTGFVMWSECTFFIIHPRLSLAAQFVHLAARGYHYLYIQICTTIIISYLCMCTYYTVFKLRIYRYYRLDPHHMTDENSLLFSAILLCRLTPPICLNVLGMIHLDSHITSDTKFGVETQFTKLMGHLDVIPILAKGINIYLPILIVLLALGTWFRLGTRFLHSLGIDQFVSNDILTVELVNSGKALVSLERNKMLRLSNCEERNQCWARYLAKKTNADLRDCSDRKPIMTTDEGEEYSSFRAVDDIFRNYNSSFVHPPSDIFDDL